MRVKSAAVMLVAVLFVGIVDVKFITWLFLGAVLYFSFEEASRLWGVASSESFIVLVATWVLAYFFDTPINVIFLLFLIMASQLAYNKSIEKKAFLPFIYPVIGMLCMWSLYIEVGMVALVWLVVIVALTDIGAYYGGRKFGTTSFSPTSPNKTLEGVFSGVCVGTVVGSIIIASSSTISFFAAFLIALLIAIASVFGDLFESYLKREAGVKDSGDTIAGHGGVLDRVDGYLFASVMLYVLMNL